MQCLSLFLWHPTNFLGLLCHAGVHVATFSTQMSSGRYVAMYCVAALYPFVFSQASLLPRRLVW